MSLINLAGLTINAAEATEQNQAIFTKTWADPTISEAHTVLTGYKMNTRIPLFGLMPETGRVTQGCNPNPVAITIPTGEVVATPVLHDFRLTHCQSNVAQDFKLWERSNKALETWEDVENPQLAFLAQRTTEAIKNAVLRISAFGDVAADVIANGGVLTAGSDNTLFNTLNGFFQQAFAGVGAGNIQRVTIAENAGATYAAQSALAANVAINTMRAMYEGIDPRAFLFSGLTYQMTRSLFNNWVAFLEDSSLAFTLDRTEKGANRYSYRGIPIIVRNDWDRNIRVYEDNATTWNLPHRMALVPAGNAPILTSDEEAFSSYDMFYDRVTRQYIIDGAFYLDAKILENYAIAVAY